MKKYLLNSIIMAIDLLFLILFFFLAYYIRIYFNQYEIPLFEQFEFNDFSFVIFIIFALMSYEKIYTLRYDFWQETLKVFKSLILSYFIVLALLMLTNYSLEYSRFFITLYFLLAIFLMPVIKRASKMMIYKFAFFKKKVLVVGDDSQMKTIQNEIMNNWYLGMEYDSKKYDTVIITSQGMSVDEINKEIEKYLNTKSSVYVVPYVTDINFAHSNIMEYSNIRLNTIQIENKLLIKHNMILKSMFELIAIIVIAPLFLLVHIVIAVLIKIDSRGAVFFKQVRVGRNGRQFVCYKYRTMYQDSDYLLEEYLQKNPREIEYYSEYHKYQNDPRITKIGHILRQTSLDELAQLINVFRRNMSLVGPRPYMPNELNKLGESQDFILKVKPGITGLWQVSGRNNLTFKERNNLEVWYIKNWSLWSDFVILIKTIKVVFLKVGAR